MKSPKNGCGNPAARAELEALLNAIYEDDLARVKGLLKKTPGLAAAWVEEARLYEGKVLHWLYAKDTALHLAAAGHRWGAAKVLIKAGADVNAAGNHRLGRAIHYAADGYVSGASYDPVSQVKTLACLRDAGADLHAVDKNGATALHRAVRTRCAAAVDFLLKAGVDPAAISAAGTTGFHLAVQNTGRGGSGDEAAKEGQRRIIEMMLERGVSAEMKDAKGKTVLEWAKSQWVREMLVGRQNVG